MEQTFTRIIKGVAMKMLISIPLVLLLISCSSQNFSGTSSDVDLQITELIDVVCVIG